uniref:Uncharacterized protein n=1 Tax=Glossina pallidipes TaxID=7398 RepID=A0A1B0AB85_GLOPL
MVPIPQEILSRLLRKFPKLWGIYERVGNGNYIEIVDILSKELNRVVTVDMVKWELGRLRRNLRKLDKETAKQTQTTYSAHLWYANKLGYKRAADIVMKQIVRDKNILTEREDFLGFGRTDVGRDIPAIDELLEAIGNMMRKDTDSEVSSLYFTCFNPENDIKSLVLDLCAQVIPGDTNENMIDEIVKILLYIATMLKDVPFMLKKEVKGNNGLDDDDGNIGMKINLSWLLHEIDN